MHGVDADNDTLYSNGVGPTYGCMQTACSLHAVCMQSAYDRMHASLVVGPRLKLPL